MYVLNLKILIYATHKRDKLETNQLKLSTETYPSIWSVARSGHTLHQALYWGCSSLLLGTRGNQVSVQDRNVTV